MARLKLLLFWWLMERLKWSSREMLAFKSSFFPAPSSSIDFLLPSFFDPLRGRFRLVPLLRLGEEASELRFMERLEWSSRGTIWIGPLMLPSKSSFCASALLVRIERLLPSFTNDLRLLFLVDDERQRPLLLLAEEEPPEPALDSVAHDLFDSCLSSLLLILGMEGRGDTKSSPSIERALRTEGLSNSELESTVSTVKEESSESKDLVRILDFFFFGVEDLLRLLLPAFLDCFFGVVNIFLLLLLLRDIIGVSSPAMRDLRLDGGTTAGGKSSSSSL
mmetsp:Transcript_27824/g.67697  ORF Transcript_27824/g.67697 Transcript_27824/m.67697 type:complete len:277 (-) Transcript_27824:972-1802(-)